MGVFFDVFEDISQGDVLEIIGALIQHLCQTHRRIGYFGRRFYRSTEFQGCPSSARNPDCTETLRIL